MIIPFFIDKKERLFNFKFIDLTEKKKEIIELISICKVCGNDVPANRFCSCFCSDTCEKVGKISEIQCDC